MHVLISKYDLDLKNTEILYLAVLLMNWYDDVLLSYIHLYMINF